MHLEDLEILIFDEADKLLDLGFMNDIEELLSFTNEDRQTLLFSATLNRGVKQLTSLALKNPVTLKIDIDNSTSELLT